MIGAVAGVGSYPTTELGVNRRDNLPAPLAGAEPVMEAAQCGIEFTQ